MEIDPWRMEGADLLRGKAEAGEDEVMQRGQRMEMIVKPTRIQPHVEDHPRRGHDTIPNEARSEGETGRQSCTNR